MAPVQTLFAVIPPVVHERHVLIHLLLASLRKPGQGILVDLLLDLLELGPFPGLGFHFAERVDDLGGGVIIRCGQDSLSQRLLFVRQNRLDELSGVVARIEEGEGGGAWCGQGEHVFVRRWVRPYHSAGEIGHVKPGHKKCCGDREGADIFLDFGFRVKMLHARELPFGY